MNKTCVVDHIPHFWGELCELHQNPYINRRAQHLVSTSLIFDRDWENRLPGALTMYFHSVHHCSLEDVQTLSWSRWQAIEFIFVFYFQRAHTQIRFCYKKTVWQSEMCPSSGTFNHFWLGKLRPHSSEIWFLSKGSIIFHIGAFWLLLGELIHNELTSFRFPVFLIRTQKS